MKRKKIKTILCHMAIISICMGVFCHGYISSFSISKFNRYYSYAEDSSVTRDDLVESFKDYCASRNLISDSSILGASSEWLGSTLRNICNSLGIDMDYLQAQISKDTSGNLGIRWLVTGTGIGLYNRIFAELLQRQNLQVGGTANQKVYQGYNYHGLMYKLYGNSSYLKVANGTSYIKEYGGSYLHDPSYYTDLFKSANPNIDYSYKTTAQSHTQVDFSLTCEDYTYTSKLRLIQQLSSSNNYRGMQPAIGWDASPQSSTLPCYVQYTNNVNWSGQGYFALFLFEDGKVGFGSIGFFKDSSGNVIRPIWIRHLFNNLPDDSEPTDVDIYTPDDKNILPAPPEDDTTIEPGGGGGGNDNPDQPGGDPDNWTPTQPTIPPSSSPDFPSVELPDIDIPDLPSLNFSLGDLRNKFPFSLPFDIIAVLNVLDGEPQAPHIQATVPIGKWYTWEMDFDFSEFDNYARIFRAFEFIGFCIGLAVFTVHFVKG